MPKQVFNPYACGQRSETTHCLVHNQLVFVSFLSNVIRKPICSCYALCVYKRLSLHRIHAANAGWSIIIDVKWKLTVVWLQALILDTLI